MSIFKVGSAFDKFDAYWYSRLLSIKAVYLTVIFFMVNLFFDLPSPPTLYMVVGMIGPLLAEMPSMNSYKQKDSVILLFAILAIVSMSIFSMIWYLKVWFILVAFSWAYILYSLLKRKPSLFPIVSLIFLMSIMSLESPVKSASLNNVFNQAIFYFQMATIGFWAHKCFPNFYFKCWHSAMLRCAETHIDSITNNQANFQKLSKHLLAAQNVMPLLENKAYYAQLWQFTQTMLELNYITTSYIKRAITITPDEFNQYKTKLLQLHENIRTWQTSTAIHYPYQDNPRLDNIFQQLNQHWKALCTNS